MIRIVRWPPGEQRPRSEQGSHALREKRASRSPFGSGR
jgi:hypothetical protein